MATRHGSTTRRAPACHSSSTVRLLGKLPSTIFCHHYKFTSVLSIVS